MKYPLASNTWDDREIKAMYDVIESGLFTMGAKVKAFEEEFAAYFGSKYACMVNSGSSANLIAIAAMFYKQENALKLGDEVIVPAVSWATTYFPLQQYGLHCKFVDIDAETLNYDLDLLAEAVTDKTKMIMMVNLLGNPNDFDAINRIIGGRNIILMEDNCESMGASYNGKMAGTHSLVGTFSSFFSHHISTMEGGVIVTDDEELYQLMVCLRAHGWTRNLPKSNHVTGEKSDNSFYESFNFVLPGYNVRPGELHGILGSEQLKKLPDFITERKKNAKLFVEKFKDHPYLKIQKEIGESSWFGFSIVVGENSPQTRDEIVALLSANEVECRPIVSGNFLKNPVMKYFDYSVAGGSKNADLIDKNGFFIGNHHYDLSQQIEFVRNLLN